MAAPTADNGTEEHSGMSDPCFSNTEQGRISLDRRSYKVVFFGVLWLLLLDIPTARSAYNLSGIPQCARSSLELAQLSATEDVGPCVLYDIDPPTNVLAQNSAKITMIQVTPSSCNDHRDGMVTGVRALNEDNMEKGVAIGYNEDHHVSGIPH